MCSLPQNVWFLVSGSLLEVSEVELWRIYFMMLELKINLVVLILRKQFKALSLFPSWFITKRRQIRNWRADWNIHFIYLAIYKPSANLLFFILRSYNFTHILNFLVNCVNPFYNESTGFDWFQRLFYIHCIPSWSCRLSERRIRGKITWFETLWLWRYCKTPCEPIQISL